MITLGSWMIKILRSVMNLEDFPMDIQTIYMQLECCEYKKSKQSKYRNKIAINITFSRKFWSRYKIFVVGKWSVSIQRSFVAAWFSIW